MLNERQRQLLQIAGIFNTNLSKVNGISPNNLHQELVREIGGNGIIDTIGLGGVRNKLDEMRANGTVHKKDNGNFGY